MYNFELASSLVQNHSYLFVHCIIFRPVWKELASHLTSLLVIVESFILGLKKFSYLPQQQFKASMAMYKPSGLSKRLLTCCDRYLTAQGYTIFESNNQWLKPKIQVMSIIKHNTHLWLPWGCTSYPAQQCQHTFKSILSSVQVCPILTSLVTASTINPPGPSQTIRGKALSVNQK